MEPAVAGECGSLGDAVLPLASLAAVLPAQTQQPEDRRSDCRHQLPARKLTPQHQVPPGRCGAAVPVLPSVLPHQISASQPDQAPLVLCLQCCVTFL